MSRPTAPKEWEPIRLVKARAGWRYRAVLTTGEHGDGRRRQTTKTFPTLTAARVWVDETRAAVRRGEFTAPDRITLDDLAASWLRSKREVREVTRQNYANALKPVLARLGGRRIQSLTRDDIDQLVEWLASDEGGLRGRGLSRKSVMYTLGRLRSLLDYAVDNGIVAGNVAARVEPPRKVHGEDDEIPTWTPEQLLRFRKVADAHRWAAGWRLTLAGLRRSEVLGMRWRDIDLDTGVVEVTQGRVLVGGHVTVIDAPKSGTGRAVAVETMQAGTSGVLRAEKTRQAKNKLAAGEVWQESGLLLVDEVGVPIRPEAYSDEFPRLCAKAKVPKIRLHAVRHSLALAMHRAGVAPADAASLLGHSVEVHLSTYVPTTKRGAQQAATALGQALATG